MPLNIDKGGRLRIGGCDAVGLARRFGTPLYVVDEQDLRDNCRRYTREFTRAAEPDMKVRVVYAAKANLTRALCRVAASEGLGLEVVSGGELYIALDAGFDPALIYMHGNNKTPEELSQALRAGVGRIVVDGLAELELLGHLAGRQRRLRARCRILLRLLPGIEAHTHDYVRTAHDECKFGLGIGNGHALRAVVRALGRSELELVGLHAHIGSQILEVEPYRLGAARVLALCRDLRRRTGWTPAELNLGGGLGISHVPQETPPAVADLATTVVSAVRREADRHGLPLPAITVEPGRSLIGDAGHTLYTVGCIKTTPGGRTFLAVDGGMADNPRPSLYGARYTALLAHKAGHAAEVAYQVVGRYCESGDVLIDSIDLPRATAGDVLCIPCTGAYNHAMSSNYNCVPRPAMVLVRHGEAHLIVRRETYADLLRRDVLPRHLAAGAPVRIGTGA